jgi:hypothetical protein
VASFFSIGLLVSDVAAARAELACALGAVFRPAVHRRTLDWEIDVSFSTQPPWLELIEGPPGSPWQPKKDAGLDHLAWWSDNLAADVERLLRAGARVEADGRRAGAMFAYLRLPETNLRLELIDVSTRAAFCERWDLEDPDEPGATTKPPPRLFKASVTVASVDRGMAELEAAVGARWGPIVSVPSGSADVRVAVSKAAPHVELVERDVDAALGLDHLAFWSDEPDVDGTRLQMAGATRIVDGTDLGDAAQLFGPTAIAGLAIALHGSSGRAGFCERWGLPAGR